jgi:hypothetical protein
MAGETTNTFTQIKALLKETYPKTKCKKCTGKKCACKKK